MNRQFSVFLDLLRFMAAFAVVISHAKHERFGGEELYWFGLFGHDAVLVFFILSGYVIAYVSDVKDKDISSYFVSRIARLYSVVVPVLIATFFMFYTPEVMSGNFSVQDIFTSLFQFFVSLLFLNQAWGAYVMPFGNMPFWSISYEFWYYAIFASVFYFKGYSRIFALTACCIIAGPKILILLPIWFLGVIAYRINKHFFFPAPRALAISALLIFSYLAYRLLKGTDFMDQLTVDIFGMEFYLSLYHSKHFLNDAIVGLLIFGVFIFMHTYFAQCSWSWLDRGERVIRWFSEFTFTLYLIHFPLFIMFNKMGFNIFANMALSFLVILVFGSFTEKKKHWFRQSIQNIFDSFKNMLGREVV